MLKMSHYIYILLLGIIAFQAVYISQSSCPAVVSEYTKYDTIYKSSPERLVFSSPLNMPTGERDTIIIRDTVTLEAPGLETVKERIVYVQRFEAKDVTFESRDTLRSDSMSVAIHDKGNCLGVLDREAVFFGKQKVISKTTIKNIVIPPKVFSLYGGVSNQIKDGKIQDITPSAMLLYKGNLSLEYGYSVLNKGHNVGLKIRVL